MPTLEETWDLREASRETFEDMVRNDPDIVGQLGDEIDERDIAVTHYLDRNTQAYAGTIRVTEDGTLYLMPDLVAEGDKISESELFDILYGA